MRSIILAVFVLSILTIISCSSEKESDLIEETFDCDLSSLSIALDSKTDATCNAGGSIIVSATDGEGVLSYSIGSITSSTGIFENISAGTYTITVTDENGCSASVSAVTVEASDNSVSAIVTATDAGCETTLATISVDASGGDGMYEYSLNGGVKTTSNTFSDQGTGDFEITVTDGNGCSTTSPITVLSGIDLNDNVMPIIISECSTSSSCHGSGASGSRPVLVTNNQIINSASRILARTANNSMPPGGGMSATQKAQIACWVNDGNF